MFLLKFCILFDWMYVSSLEKEDKPHSFSSTVFFHSYKFFFSFFCSLICFLFGVISFFSFLNILSKFLSVFLIYIFQCFFIFSKFWFFPCFLLFIYFFGYNFVSFHFLFNNLSSSF